MRGIVAVCFLLMASFTWGQSLENSLLWQIVPVHEGVDTSYLFGTVHSKDDRAFKFGEATLPAMASCAVVVGELDLDKAGPDMFQMLARIRMGDGKTLEDLYTKKQWELVSAFLTEQLGAAAAITYGTKPFFVLAMLAETEMGNDHPEVLDQYLMSTAQANGQRTLGLETVAEQMEALDAISLKEQASMLLDHVEHDRSPGEMDAMLDAYAAQDLEKLLATAEKSGMSKSMEQALLTQRNTRMVHRMDSLMTVEKSAFFLIGAAHLPSPVGLIEGLRAKGYRLEPVFGTKSGPVEFERH